MKKTFFAMMAMAVATTAQAVQIELLTNGDGSTLDGWDEGWFSIVTAGSENDSWFTVGGTVSEMSQTITLSDFKITEEDIQSSPTMTASVTAWANWGSKVCKVRVDEIDESGTISHSHTILSWPESSEYQTSPTTVSINFNLDSGTRQLKFAIRGQNYHTNWSGTGYGPKFRNCSLTINKTLSFTFASAGATLGTSSDDAPPIAPRHGDDIFQGYFTEGGVQVYDGNYEFVMDASSALDLPENTILYAQWKAVPRNLEGGITRLVYRGVLTNFGEWTSGLKKDMAVKVYDSASATTPLWSGSVADVPINPDGSFEAVFGNDELAYAFASNDVTHVELTVGDALSPLAPRRAFASVASVNRALVAEGAASDIKIGTLGANTLMAEKTVAGSLEATGTVRVEGSVAVEVKPFDIERGQETTIWRGTGVSAWGDSARVATTNGVVAGQWLWTADREGVAVIHCSGENRSTLRIPATIQFVRPGDEVRAPTYDSGEVAVTVWGYKK